MAFREVALRKLCGCVAAAIVSLPWAGWAQATSEPVPVVAVDNAPNSAAAQARPYVVLVSLDGFRYDYAAKFGAPHLEAMAREGVSAPEGMLPSYPSLTFPNHYTLVTGLYPEHHGIVGNSFYDPVRKETYVYTRAETNGDGSWYGGVPLWSLAESQGMRSACLFWPGSEAKTAGFRPSYYLHFNDGLDDRRRLDQVVAWLGLPAAERPHFITLYYSNTDHAGHGFGPDSAEERAAVHRVDDLMGELETRLKATRLPVDLIVVADHGMVALQPPPVDLSSFADLKGVKTVGSLLYAKDEAEAARLVAEFTAHPSERFKVYRRAAVPGRLEFDGNPREGDPVVVATGPYVLLTQPAVAAESGQVHGGHGFDPRAMPEMKALFVAEGPDFVRGKRLKTFENVDVYPLIAQVLGLRAPVVDGTLKPVEAGLTKAARKRRVE